MIVEGLQLAVTLSDTDDELGDRRDTILVDVTSPLADVDEAGLTAEAVAEFQRRTQGIKDQLAEPLPVVVASPDDAFRDAQQALMAATIAVQAALESATTEG